MKAVIFIHRNSSLLLTPETFITALANFTILFQPAKIRIEFTTSVSCLECQQIEAVFEALHSSPFYNGDFDRACELIDDFDRECVF